MASLRANDLFVDRKIAIDHAIDGELTRNGVTTAAAFRKRGGDPIGHVADITADGSIDAVPHNFLDGSAGECKDRRAARHGLNHHQPERLFPLNGKQERSGSRQQ